MPYNPIPQRLVSKQSRQRRSCPRVPIHLVGTDMDVDGASGEPEQLRVSSESDLDSSRMRVKRRSDISLYMSTRIKEEKKKWTPHFLFLETTTKKKLQVKQNYLKSLPPEPRLCLSGSTLVAFWPLMRLLRLFDPDKGKDRTCSRTGIKASFVSFSFFPS